MGSVVQFTRDTLRSFVNALGLVGGNKAASTYYMPLEMTDSDLLATYRATWLAKKIINIPAFDSIRAWRSWQASADQITKIENEEKRLGLRNKVLQALIRARLFGGSAIYIGTGDPDLLDPIDLNRLGGIQFLTGLNRRQLQVGEIETDPASDLFGKPRFYQIAQSNGTPVRIHPSRLVLFYGEEVPDAELVSTTQGWSDSVLVSLMKDIKNADATTQNIASLVFEAKVDIFKIPGLMNNLADPVYERRLLDRIGLAASAKGIDGALLMDKEEDYEQKSISFDKLPEILQQFLQIVAGAADIPVTRLLGQSPAGMNATGESDIRNYYDRISSIQNVHLSPAMDTLDECLIRSALGTRPPEVFYVWSSLWQVSDKERAEIGEKIASTIEKLNGTQLFPQEALANAATNMLVEAAVMPGLEEDIELAGGLPDYEAELEEAREREAAALAANENTRAVRVANDGRTMLADATPRTLYMRRDVLNQDDIVAHFKSQGFETTVDDMHVTIVYSKAPFDWMKMGEDYGTDTNGEITVSAGGPRAIEQFGTAIVMEISNSRLQWRHEDAKRAGASFDYDEYRPHVTITYQGLPSGKMLGDIRPWTGPIVLGPEIYEEIDPMPEINES